MTLVILLQSICILNPNTINIVVYCRRQTYLSKAIVLITVKTVPTILVAVGNLGVTVTEVTVNSDGKPWTENRGDTHVTVSHRFDVVVDHHLLTFLPRIWCGIKPGTHYTTICCKLDVEST